MSHHITTGSIAGMIAAAVLAVSPASAAAAKVDLWGCAELASSAERSFGADARGSLRPAIRRTEWPARTKRTYLRGAGSWGGGGCVKAIEIHLSEARNYSGLFGVQRGSWPTIAADGGWTARTTRAVKAYYDTFSRRPPNEAALDRTGRVDGSITAHMASQCNDAWLYFRHDSRAC